MGKLTGSSQEVHQYATLADVLQTPVTIGRRIAVTSIRGGAGKSTVAALIATGLAHFRQDRVLALDADPGVGSLMLRLGMVSAPDIRDLLGAAGFGSFDDVRPYLAQTESGVWALGAGNTGLGGIEHGSYETAIRMIGRFFGITVVDCGAGLTGDLQRYVLGDVHAQVLVTPATPDGALAARRTLDWLAATYPELALRTAVVFMEHAPDASIDFDLAAETLPPWVPDLIRLGFDRHLAEGSIIDPARLAVPSRVSALRVAARALVLATGRGPAS